MNFQTSSLCALLMLSLASCNNSSSSASTPAPDVKQAGCITESELEKAGIVGGEKVSNTDADSKKVMLLYAQDEDEKTSICTASAIAPNVLLTAAHCIREKHFVVLNSSISCESGFDASKHIAEVRGVLKHKDWDLESTSGSNSAKDVAIVVLKENLPSSYRVLKIADPTRVDFANGEIRFIGYGVVDYNSGGSGILRRTSIPISKVTANTNKNIVEIDQSNGQGVCSGDSGGPSLVKIDGVEQILGINSVVAGTEDASLCRDGAIQSLASGHIPWIKSELAKVGIMINL
jgi:secreted trypsin-like serine protease